MTKLSMIAIALTLALGTGCKKDEAAAPPATKDNAGADPKVTEPGPVAKAEPKADPKVEPTTPPAGDGLKLTWKAAAVGSHETQTDVQTSAFTITMPDGTTTVEGTQRKERIIHTEVLESGDVVTKAKIHYERFKEGGTVGGKPKDKAVPVDGKTYVVWFDAGAIKASTEDGKDVSPEELAEITDHVDDEIGMVPRIPRVLAARIWKQGEAAALTADELAMLADDGMTAEAATVTLVSSDATSAMFSLEMKTRKVDPADKSDMAIPMKITAKVEVATLRLIELSLTATMEGSVKGMAMKGTMEGTKTSTMK